MLRSFNPKKERKKGVTAHLAASPGGEKKEDVIAFVLCQGFNLACMGQVIFWREPRLRAHVNLVIDDKKLVLDISFAKWNRNLVLCMRYLIL